MTTEELNELIQPIDEEGAWIAGRADISSLTHAFADSSDKGDAYKFCLRYAQRFPDMLAHRIGIRLHGEVGTGKTFYASCIGSFITRLGYPVRWIDCKNFVSYMADFRSHNDVYIGNILDSEILIIDDLDTKKLNSMELSCLFRLINARENAVTIITTNMTPKSISENDATDMDEKRAMSRIQALCPLKVVLTGKDRRKNVAYDKMLIAEKLIKGWDE